jgi:hypothetical protein
MKKNALRINVETKTIEHITIGDWKEISQAIGNGCELFCCPVTFDNEDTIYCDDESLLRYDDIKGGFIMEGWAIPLLGNAIVLGADEEGESGNAKTTAEELMSEIVWVSKDNAKTYAKLAMGQPMQIYSW